MTYAEKLFFTIKNTGTSLFNDFLSIANSRVPLDSFFRSSNDERLVLNVCRLGVTKAEMEEIIKGFFDDFGGAREKHDLTIEWSDESWEKDIGNYEDEWGYEHPIYKTIECWAITIKGLPAREECVALFRKGSTFDTQEQTLSKGDPLYYCEVMSILAS